MEKIETFKTILESQAYEDQKARLNREINSFKLEIDRSVFKKTPVQKVEAAVAKAEYKRLQRLNQ